MELTENITVNGWKFELVENTVKNYLRILKTKSIT
jgi:hypothetical protein